MKLTVNATVITSQKQTGIERYTLRISQELYKLNCCVDIVCTEAIPGVFSDIQPTILKIARQFLGKYEYIYRAIWDQTFFRLHVIKTKPDVVFFPIQDGFLSPPVKQIVTVYDLHYLHFDKIIPDCKYEISYLRTKLYHLKMPHILEHSAAVVAISEATKKDLVDSFNINPDKIHVIYCGYDDQRFRIIDNPQAILDHYGLQSGEYFLYVGSILRHKNILRLVQAFALLEGKTKLVLAGVCKDVDYLEEIKKIASCSGVSDKHLFYLEYVPDEDLPYLYTGAISFMLPSLHEGFGIPIIEAMACGTPVITSNCSSMPEVAGNAAVLVDPFSVESISAAMKEVIDSPRSADSLRMAGLGRAKMFRWSYSAQKLYDLCEMVSKA